MDKRESISWLIAFLQKSASEDDVGSPSRLEEKKSDTKSMAVPAGSLLPALKSGLLYSSILGLIEGGMEILVVRIPTVNRQKRKFMLKIVSV